MPEPGVEQGGDVFLEQIQALVSSPLGLEDLGPQLDDLAHSLHYQPRRRGPTTRPG